MNPLPLPPDLIETAALWLVRQQDDGLGVAEQAELAEWLAQDARHAEALAFARRTWESLAALG